MLNYKKYLALTSLSAVVLLASCKPTIKNLDEYKKQPVANTEYMPTADLLANNVPSVVVFEFEDSTEHSNETGLKKYLPSKIEGILVSEKLAKILSRDASANLKKEIQLAESNSKSVKSIATNANFAVIGDITAVNFSSSDVTVAKQSSNNLLLDAVKKQDREYKYEAGITATAKIYSLPEMTLLESIPFEASANATEKAKVKKDGFVSREYESAKQFDANLVKKAAEAAVKKAQVAIKNVFAKTGYVSEIREFKGKFIAKITLGSKDGIFHGANLILTQKTSSEGLNGDAIVESVTLGKGVVSNQITSNSAWIVVDAEIAKKLKIGDAAKVIYKKSFL